MNTSSEETDKNSIVPQIDKVLLPIVVESEVGLASKFRQTFARLPRALNSTQVLILLKNHITPELLKLFESQNYSIIVPIPSSINGNGYLYNHEMLIRILFAVQVLDEYLKSVNKDKPSGHDYSFIRRRIARGFDFLHRRSSYIETIEKLIELNEDQPFVFAKVIPTVETLGADDDFTQEVNTDNLEQ